MNYWSGKRVVVTGARGFLGSHLMERLRALDCAAIFEVKSSEYNLSKENDVARLFSDLKKGREGWRPAANKGAVDVVIHLAGLVGGIGANKAKPADFFYQNLMMGVLTMHHSWLAGAQKFVAAGAGCGYPQFAPMPLNESSFWDGFPQQESAPYSLAKRMLHVQSLAYWRQHGFPAITTIPGNIYGPYDNFDLENAHVVPALVRKFVENDPEITIWGSGKPTRDFVYAGDVADGILLAAEKYNESQLVNLSSGQDTSVRDLVEILREITGYSGKIRWDASRPDGQSRRVFDISKAEREIEFAPRITLRDGLQKTVDWYRINREVARNDVPIAKTA